MENKTIGAFIAVLRKAKGMTQKQLAEMLNVSDKAVSRWERDECAPDLSVIPVLAEIFGITADELLRGQRKTANEPETKYEVQRTEKQLRYLLKKKETDYTILCCVSIGIALFGLIAAMIGNLGFLRAYLGFFVSCFFFISAVLCQVIFLVQGLRSLEVEDLEEEAVNSRKFMILQTELAFSVCACLFAVCLPLLLLVTDTYAGLSASSWAEHGLLWAGITAAICTVACYFINICLGYQKLPDMKKPRNKLQLHTTLILIVVLLVTFIAHEALRGTLESNPHLFFPGTRWDNWEDLKEYLETPIASNGKELELISRTQRNGFDECEYRDKDGYLYYLNDKYNVLVYEADMETPKYEYIERNHTVFTFSYGNERAHFPIYTYTKTEYSHAMQRLLFINLCICSIYVIEIIAGILIYRCKSKKLPQSK